jgi:UPF0755 protein
MKSPSFIREAKKVADYRKKYKFIPAKAKNLEGYLFPDTYYVLRDFKASQLVEKMLAVFDKKIYQIYGDLDLPKQLDDFDQTVIFASIIEKEANDYEDKRIVVDIFLKRLGNNIPFQACSTVNYLLDEPKPVLSRTDISIDSKYNTYLYKGLPPGPICSPGEDSIRSIYSRKDTDFWFFLSDKDGNIYFSKDNQEHERKKDKYLN